MKRIMIASALAALTGTAVTGGAAAALANSPDASHTESAVSTRSTAAPDPKASRRVAVPDGHRTAAVRDLNATRVNWGNRNGCWRLNLYRADITRDTVVVASAHEGYPGFIGGAKYTVHNVAPFDGGVSARVCVDWGSPISLFVDYVIAQR